MWSLDVDNIPHPHISFESSGQSSYGNSPSTGNSPGSTAVVEHDGVCQQHEHYFFADDNVVFQVENTRYKIHRYFFQRDSQIFASVFALPARPGHGSSEYNTIRLIGVKAHDFDLFLSMLYPAQIGVYSAATVEEWSSILNLAAKWKFESIRTLAIERLTSLASPIDKIVLGRKHNILDWLGDAYQAVCQRQDSLTLEEASQLSLADVVKISSLRQDIRSSGKIRLPTNVSPHRISEAFGLDDSQKKVHTSLDTHGEAKQCYEESLKSVGRSRQPSISPTPVASADYLDWGEEAVSGKDSGDQEKLGDGWGLEYRIMGGSSVMEDSNEKEDDDDWCPGPNRGKKKYGRI